MNLSSIEIAFKYGNEPETLRKEIDRNIRTIMSTPIGTCPLYRQFGIDISMLDNPSPAAKNMLTVAIIDAIETWEPRVNVTDATVTIGTDGEMRAKVVIEIGQPT